MSAPLLITTDAVLLDEVQRLAAAAGVTPEVCTSDHHALTRWADAPLVLVGADVAADLAALRPARRDATHLLVHGSMGDDIFSVALALGAESVAELPRSESWLVEVLTDAGDRAPRRGLTIGVVGGSGGAGATTFACALGQVGAGQMSASQVGAGQVAGGQVAGGQGGNGVRGKARTSALVIDLDPLGPGLDRVLGVELQDGIRWDALLETTGRLSARSLHDAVPRREGLGILTWSPGPAGTLQAFAVREALSAAQRGHDLVVVDLPRTVDALFSEVVARCDLLVVVTRPTVAGVASTARLRARLNRAGPTRLMVRGHGVPVREVEQATGLPAAWTMGEQRGLAEAIDLGLGPVRSRRGPLARAAAEALAELSAGPRRGVAA